MLGVFEKKIGFFDLAKLRFGVYKGWEWGRDNTQIIKFLPPGAFKVVEVRDVLPNSVKPCTVYDPKMGFSSMMVMYAGERGESPFISENLSEGGRVVELIKAIKEKERHHNVARAAAASAVRNTLRGEKNVLKDASEKFELMENSIQQKGYSINRFGKKRNY